MGEEYNTSDKSLIYTYGTHAYGTAPYSTDVGSWGLPKMYSDTWTTEAPDQIYLGEFGYALIVGGPCFTGDDAGLSYLHPANEEGFRISGSRLAFLFTTDSTAKLSVEYMDDGTPLKSDNVQKGQVYTIADPMSTKEGFVFVGWSDGTEVYHPGDRITVERSITLTAVWGHAVTFDLKGGTWGRTDTVAAQGGTYAVPSAVPTKSGCTFKEWRCGNDSVLPGGTIDLSSDVTLQAVWTSGFIPIIPDDGDDPIEVVVDGKEGSVSGVDGKSILLIAIIVAIIAELAVLAISRKG